MGRIVACMFYKTNACRVVVSKPKGKSLLGSPGRSWEETVGSLRRSVFDEVSTNF
jgi:hypothetical protein